MLVFSYQFRMSMDCLIFKRVYISLKCPFFIVISMKCHSSNVIYMSILSIYHLSLNCHIYELTYQYSEDDFLP